jgi:hypothetical protein
MTRETDMEVKPLLGAVEALKKEDRKVALLVFLFFVALTLWICLLPQEYKSGSALSRSSMQPTEPEASKGLKATGAPDPAEPARCERPRDPGQRPSDSSRR